jgi:integrase
MTDALRELLLRLRAERPANAGQDDRLVPINDAKTTIRKTCKRLGYPQFTHHDFRHFFATTCIESGVDIPTISRWLGHKDGGALAMRVYGHLREEHSRAQIKRVTFEPARNLVRMPDNSQAKS